MEREWIYLNNPFLNATEDNFSKFNSVINFSNVRFNAKAGDTFYDKIIAVLAPSCAAWNIIYPKWLESQGEHKSTTNTVQVLIKDLSGTHISSWVRRIAVVFEPGSSNYIRLLPHGSKPFQNGKQVNRILAVENLITAIGTNAALAAVKTEAQAFFTAITTAKNEQSADLNDTDEFSNACETQRIASCIALWQTMSMMIQNYTATPSVIGNYYDQQNLRSQEQVSYTHTLHTSATATIVKRKLTDTMQIRIINDSNADIKVAYTPEKNDPVGSTFVTVPANEDITVAANMLGNITTGHFIKVNNLSTLIAAHFTIIIIK